MDLIGLQQRYLSKKVNQQINLAYNINNDVEYVGYSEPGTADSEAAWHILKLGYTGNNVTSVKFADGTTTYSKVWDNRATYSY